MVDLKATQGRLVIKELQNSDTTAGGIVLAQPVNGNLCFGVIESVGLPKNDDVKQSFEVGQTVAWNKGAGSSYLFGSDNYVIIEQSSILAIKD